MNIYPISEFNIKVDKAIKKIDTIIQVRKLQITPFLISVGLSCCYFWEKFGTCCCQSNREYDKSNRSKLAQLK